MSLHILGFWGGIIIWLPPIRNSMPHIPNFLEDYLFLSPGASRRRVIYAFIFGADFTTGIDVGMRRRSFSEHLPSAALLISFACVTVLLFRFLKNSRNYPAPAGFLFSRGCAPSFFLQK